MSILGDRIKKERENLGLTREELSKKVGVSYSAIAMYEQGNREPNNEITIKMCELFNCTMDYIMGKSNFRTNEEDFNNFVKNQNKVLILKTIERYYDDYIVTCSLKEQDIDFIVAILSDVDENNVKDIKEQINSFVNSFDNDKKKKVRELINIIIKELLYDIENKNTYNYYCTLMDKKNNNTLNNNFYMTPVYRKYISRAA